MKKTTVRDETETMTPAQARKSLKKFSKNKLIAIIINLSDKVDEQNERLAQFSE